MAVLQTPKSSRYPATFQALIRGKLSSFHGRVRALNLKQIYGRHLQQLHELQIPWSNCLVWLRLLGGRRGLGSGFIRMG
jgi:hypothetical protein